MLLELLSLFTVTPFPPLPVPMTPPPISVQVMSESLCIDCQRFFQKSLIPAYRTLGPSVMDLQVIPFGNSRIDYDLQTVTCQHGEAECDANIWQQCAVDQNPPPVYIDFFDCLEGVLPMGHRDEPFDESIFRQCAGKSSASQATLRGSSSSIDFGPLKACHDDPVMVWSLQTKYAKKTPPHSFVPWVLVDHQFVDVDQQDFFEEVCQAFMAKGGTHPACTSASYGVVKTTLDTDDSILMDQENDSEDSNGIADTKEIDMSIGDGISSHETGLTTLNETPTSIADDTVNEHNMENEPIKKNPDIIDDTKKEEDDGSSLLYQDVDGGSSFFFFFSKSGTRSHGHYHHHDHDHHPPS